MGPLLTYLLTAFFNLFWLSGRDGQSFYRTVDTFPNPIPMVAATPIWATKPLQLHVEVVSKPCRTWNGKKWWNQRPEHHHVLFEMNMFQIRSTSLILVQRHICLQIETWNVICSARLEASIKLFIFKSYDGWFDIGDAFWLMPYSVTLLLVHTRYYSSTVNTCCKNEAHYNIVGIRMTSEAKKPEFLNTVLNWTGM